MFRLLFNFSCLTVTRLHTFVHLSDTAAITIEVTFTTSGAATACPAKLVTAQVACHVVTALVLFDFCATHRAEGDVVLVLFCPAQQLVLHGVFARTTFVPLLTALETDVCSAFRTGELLISGAFASHVLTTTLFRAPADKKV